LKWDEIDLKGRAQTRIATIRKSSKTRKEDYLFIRPRIQASQRLATAKDNKIRKAPQYSKRMK